MAICAASLVLAVGVSLWAAVVDARERTIPNAACVGVAAAGLVFGLVRARTGLLPAFPPLTRCLAAALAELAAGTLLELGYRRLSGRVGRVWETSSSSPHGVASSVVGASSGLHWRASRARCSPSFAASGHSPSGPGLPAPSASSESPSPSQVSRLARIA